MHSTLKHSPHPHTSAEQALTATNVTAPPNHPPPPSSLVQEGFFSLLVINVTVGSQHSSPVPEMEFRQHTHMQYEYSHVLSTHTLTHMSFLPIHLYTPTFSPIHVFTHIHMATCTTMHKPTPAHVLHSTLSTPPWPDNALTFYADTHSRPHTPFEYIHAVPSDTNMYPVH